MKSTINQFFLALIMVSLFSTVAYGQKKPRWVEKRPINSLSYTGIGMCKKSDPDFLKVAKQTALSDIASQIKVKISSTSLLATCEDLRGYRSKFENNIQEDVNQEFENARLIDTWQNDKEYWVYYELSRFDYEDYLEAQRNSAIRSGSDFLAKGDAAIASGQLTTAVELYTKGLSAIRPAIHQDLTCQYKGSTINLSSELYQRITTVFDGLQIATNPTSLEMEPFTDKPSGVGIGVYKEQTPLQGIQLLAKFKAGSGDMSPVSTTDSKGYAALYVNKITAKQSQQSIELTMDKTRFVPFENDFNREILKKLYSKMPSAIIPIQVANSQINASICMSRNDVPALSGCLQTVLSNNFFNLVDNADMADVLVRSQITAKSNGKEHGEMYDFETFVVKADIELIDHRTQRVMTAIHPSTKVIVPENKSTSAAQAMLARAMCKKIKRSLSSSVLGNLQITREGRIPKGDCPNSQVVSNPISMPKPQAPVKRNPPTQRPKVVYVPVPVPVSKPAPQPVQAKPEPKVSRGQELASGVFIDLLSKKEAGNKTTFYFNIRNTTNSDFRINLYFDRIKIFDKSGMRHQLRKLKISDAYRTSYQLSYTVIPQFSIPMEMTIKGTNHDIKYLSIQDGERREVVFR